MSTTLSKPTYNQDLLELYLRAQAGITNHKTPSHYLETIRSQSLKLIDGFINGEIIITTDAYEKMEKLIIQVRFHSGYLIRRKMDKALRIIALHRKNFKAEHLIPPQAPLTSHKIHNLNTPLKNSASGSPENSAPQNKRSGNKAETNTSSQIKVLHYKEFPQHIKQQLHQKQPLLNYKKPEAREKQRTTSQKWKNWIFLSSSALRTIFSGRKTPTPSNSPFKNSRLLFTPPPPQLTNAYLCGNIPNEKETYYYDKALEIHLQSAKARDDLYIKIQELAKTGNIVFSEGTNYKWYAHAFTMYKLIRPNSPETRVINRLLSGDKNMDQKYINNLVIQAGKTGFGVKSENTKDAI